MKRIMILAAVAAIGCGGALAQSDSGPAATPTPAPTSDAARTTREEVKQIRLKCRDDAIARGMKGEARRADIDACFTKARPDLARAYECRKEAAAKNLTGGDLWAYVKQCKSTAQ